MREFIIWGRRKEVSAEDVLGEEVLISEKSNLKSLAHAEKYIELLSTKYGCHSMRVQIIDGSEIDWNSAIS